jgi:hypothetical protein
MIGSIADSEGTGIAPLLGIWPMDRNRIGLGVGRTCSVVLARRTGV